MDIKKGYHDYQSIGFVHLRVYITSHVSLDEALGAVGKAADKLIADLQAAGLNAKLRHEPKLEPLPFSRLKYEASIEVTGTEPTDPKDRFARLSKKQNALMTGILKADKGIIKIGKD